MNIINLILYDILFEAKQVGLLYYGAWEESVDKIIMTDTIRSTYRDTHEDEVSYKLGIGNKEYTSLSRNLNWVRKTYGIIFVIDGNKLSQKYRIVPFNYAPYDYGNSNADEMEERVVGQIKPLSKYLIKIIVDWDMFAKARIKPNFNLLHNIFKNKKIEHLAKTAMGMDYKRSFLENNDEFNRK